MTDTKTNLMRKIQGLLAKAEATPFSAEAQAFREKAEELMTIHAIEAFELEKHDPTKRSKPIKRTGIKVAEGGSIIHTQLIQLWSNLVTHTNCRAVLHGAGNPKWSVSSTVIGFPEDVDYLEMLFTSLRMTMARDLEPKYDPDRTKDQNVRTMKEAGMKWERIAQLCDIPYPGSECITRYKRQCKKDGVEPIKANPTNYVRNWAEGFVTEISTRLRQMREASYKAAEERGQGDLLPAVIKSKAEDVTQMYHQEFKDLRPVRLNGPGKFNGNARMRGAESGRNADLSGGRNQATTANHGKALGS